MFLCPNPSWTVMGRGGGEGRKTRLGKGGAALGRRRATPQSLTTLDGGGGLKGEREEGRRDNVGKRSPSSFHPSLPSPPLCFLQQRVESPDVVGAGGEAVASCCSPQHSAEWVGSAGRGLGGGAGSNERAPEASGTLDTEHLDGLGEGRVRKEGLHPAYRASRTLTGSGVRAILLFFFFKRNRLTTVQFGYIFCLSWPVILRLNLLA